MSTKNHIMLNHPDNIGTNGSFFKVMSRLLKNGMIPDGPIFEQL